MDTLKKLFDLLSAQERKRAALLMGMILVMALLDVVGVASIMPFMAVLANPQLVETNPLLNAAYTQLGFSDPQAFLFAMGLVVFVLLVASLAFKALTTYAQTRFALMREYSIGKRLVEGYLHQPYSWFLSRHSADLGKTILSEVGTVVNKGMLPFMTLMAQTAVAIGLLALLLVVDPVLALLVGVVLGVAYGAIFTIMGGWLKRLGQARVNANKQRFTALIEAFGAAKEVKVGGLEQAYIQRFARPAQIYAQGQATAQVIGQLPRYFIEASYREGTPRTVLEAMAMGRAIVTTDAPGCRETVVHGGNGFLVPVQDAEALAQAMRRFIEEPALQTSMGARARQMAEDKYDVHKVNAVMLAGMGLE
jgi:ATP-binding cassette, subfamily B, bacterial PglK